MELKTGAEPGGYSRGMSQLTNSMNVGQKPTEGSVSLDTPKGYIAPIAEPANEILSFLWPRISHWAHELITKEIGPMVRSALPSQLQGADFDKDRCHLGDEAVQFTSIKIFDRKEKTAEGMCENIVFRCRFEWNADLNVMFKVAGAEMGVQGMVMKGQLLVELVHMISYPPMFKGVRLFFLDAPEMELNFAGTGSDLLNMSIIHRRIMDVFTSVLASTCVAPRYRGFKLISQVDLFSIVSPPPEGILWVTVWNANDLLAMDTNFFGKGTSDPYVKVRIGAHVFRSETQYKTLSPVFNYKLSVPITSLHDQRIWIELYDHDFITRDDFLGRVSVPVELLATWGKEKKVTVSLRDEFDQKGKNGSVTLSAEWQPVVQEVDAAGQDHPAGVITAGVFCAMQLPDVDETTQYWVTATCTDLMPCATQHDVENATAHELTTEKTHAVEVQEEWDEKSDPVNLRLMKEKVDLLRKHGMSDKDIMKVLDLAGASERLEADNSSAARFLLDKASGGRIARWRAGLQFLTKKGPDAAITFRLHMQKGEKTQALGEYQRQLRDLENLPDMTAYETVQLAGTDILIRIRLQLRFLAKSAISRAPVERKRTYQMERMEKVSV